MLSEEQTSKIIKFVPDVLKISNPMEKKAQDPKKLLQDIIVAFYAAIPFQNITLADEDRWHKPTLDEVIDDVTSGCGGLCYTLGVFMKYLLETLNYEASHVTATMSTPAGYADNHILCLVTNVETHGDKYLVDVSGYPVFELISLDFEKESCVYNNSFLEYKFGWESEKCLVRYHRRGESRPMAPGEVITDGWRRVCIVDPTPRDLSFFDEPMRKAFADSELARKITPFHSTLRLVSFHGPDMKAVCMKDKTLLVENDAHVLVPQKLATGQEVVEKIAELFPNLREAAEKGVKLLKL